MRFSSEIRHRAVIHYTHFTKSVRKVAALYEIPKSTLHRWIARSTSADAQRRATAPKKSTEQAECIDAVIARFMRQNPFATMNDLALELRRALNLRVSRSTAGRYRRKCGLTYKRAFQTVHSATRDMAAVRHFCQEFAAASSGDDDVVVSIDETGFYVGENPSRGYAPIGKRLHAVRANTLRLQKFSVIMAITASGIAKWTVLAHNCKKADFVRFIDELPCPRGSALVLDNIAFHHSVETRAAAAARGFRLLHCPTYSPKFNPIENAFGVVKAAFRSMSASASTSLIPALPARQLIDAAIQENAQRDFRPFFARTRAFCLAELARQAAGGDASGYCGYA